MQHNFPQNKFRSVIAALGILGANAVAQLPPNTNAPSAIDLSPGSDVYAPRLFALNQQSHKLYVVGDSSTGSIDFGLKVISTTTLSVTTGIDLGRYGNGQSFYVEGLAVDESAAPNGNKIYLVGKPGTTNDYLRVIDGETDSNLTGENTDLFLPISAGNEALACFAVNSSNHKLYLAKADGDIVVVDGASRQVITTLTPNAGSFVIANPAANKVFVVNHNGGGVIDSSTDTFSALSLTFTASDAILDSSASKIYFVGSDQALHPGIFAVDANTGELLSSNTSLPSSPLSITLVPDENAVCVGNAINVSLYDRDTLALRTTISQPAIHLAYDPTTTGLIFYLHDPTVTDDNLQNLVGLFNRTLVANPETHALNQSPFRPGIAVGYRPFALASNNLTHRIYATDEQTPELLTIDADQHTAIGRTHVASGENGGAVAQRYLAVSERLNRVYVPQVLYSPTSTPNIANFINIYDGTSRQLLDSIVIDPMYNIGASKIAVDDTRRRLYVPVLQSYNIGNNLLALLVYDEDTDQLITTTALGTGFFSYADIAVNQVTGRIYITGSFPDDGGLLVIDGNSYAIVDSLAPTGMLAINRKTNTIYVADTPSYTSQNNISVVDGGTDQVATTIPTDPVAAITVDETANILYAATTSQTPATANPILAFDGNNNYQLLGQITAGQSPVGLALNTATRELYVSNDYDGTLSVIQNTLPKPSNLLGNISTRGEVGTGDAALIGGFIITGPQNSTKRVIIRAIGPSLAQAGVEGTLADPMIELHDSAGNIVTNDNWKVNDQTGLSQEAEITATGIAPTNDLESALIADLPPGPCTAIVRGKDGQTGIGLVEAYDFDQAAATQLANISTRGLVLAGDNVLIGGVIVLGSEPSKVVVRAIGPSLAQSGIQDSLADPTVELHDPNGALISSNDNWKDSDQQEISDTGLAPADDRESALVATLFPANYTAIVRSKDGQTGIALVEVYNLQ